jgi:drug/metabolite transporter (DMT)-like permease
MNIPFEKEKSMESKSSYIIAIGLPLVSVFVLIWSFNTHEMFLFFGIICALITGLLATFVGITKKRDNAESFAIGYLFSLIGVVIVALLPSKEDTSNKKHCPFCKELIHLEATKCPHCQSDLTET